MKFKQAVGSSVIAMALLGCTSGVDAQSDATLQGAWLLEDIAGLPVIDRSPATIAFNDDGRAGGNGSCNQSFSGYELSGARLNLGEVASTRRMCSETLMDQEQRLFETLPRVWQWKVENGLLLLLDDAGVEVLRASRLEE